MANNSTLIVYGIGDSVMWGQGLRKAHKFLNTAGQALAKEWRYKDYECYNFARSGAVVTKKRTHDNEAEARFGDNTYNSNIAYSRELPCAFPTIEEQINIAATTRSSAETFSSRRIRQHKNEDVDVIFLNGGINDVNVKNILTGNSNLMAKITIETHRQYSNNILPLLKQQFPNALIVVLGYFPIIGPESNHDKTIRVLRYLQNTTAYNAAELDFAEYVEDLEDIPIVGEAVSEIVDFGASLLSGKDVDTDEYTEAYNRAVYASGFYYRTQNYYRAASVTNANLYKGCNAIYVDSGFAPNNAALCSKAGLFALGGDFLALKVPLLPSIHSGYNDVSPQDEVVSERVAAINHFAEYYRNKPDVYNKSVRASVGHPNISGAKRYSNAIIKRLKELKRVSMKSHFSPHVAPNKKLISFKEVMSKTGNEQFSSMRSLAYQTHIQSLLLEVHFHRKQDALAFATYFACHLKYYGRRCRLIPFKVSQNVVKLFPETNRHLPERLIDLYGFELALSPAFSLPMTLNDIKFNKTVLVINGIIVNEFTRDYQANTSSSLQYNYEV